MKHNKMNSDAIALNLNHLKTHLSNDDFNPDPLEINNDFTLTKWGENDINNNMLSNQQNSSIPRPILANTCHNEVERNVENVEQNMSFAQHDHPPENEVRQLPDSAKNRTTCSQNLKVDTGNKNFDFTLAKWMENDIRRRSQSNQ